MNYYDLIKVGEKFLAKKKILRPKYESILLFSKINKINFNNYFINKKRIVSKKIDQRSLIIFNNKLKKDTDIKITNLLNEKYLIAKVGKSSKYPIFYNSVISERIATELDIDPDQPYVRVETINSSCLLYTSPSPRDRIASRMPSSA